MLESTASTASLAADLLAPVSLATASINSALFIHPPFGRELPDCNLANQPEISDSLAFFGEFGNCGINPGPREIPDFEALDDLPLPSLRAAGEGRDETFRHPV